MMGLMDLNIQLLSYTFGASRVFSTVCPCIIELFEDSSMDFFFLLSNYEECNIVLVSVFQTYLCVTILGLQLIHFTFLFFTANRMHMQQAS